MQALHHWGFYPALPKSSGSFARSKAGRRGKGWMGNRQLLASRTWLAGICLALLCTAGVTPAVTQEQARRQTEASMLLTGMIEIAADGGVRGYSIDHEDKVPDYVRANIAQWVPAWRFAPRLAAGQAVADRVKEEMGQAAKPPADGPFRLYN